MTVVGRPPLEHVVVIGGGQVALLAAVAVRRALPRTEVIIADAPVAANAMADHAHGSLPSLARLHARIGIDEAGMIARAAASHRLATRYRGWLEDGRDWLLGYGAAADPAWNSGFTARWAGAAAAARGTTSETGDTIAAALGVAGRFAPPSDDAASPLSDLDYALRFDPTGHRRRLWSLARHLGVTQGAMEAGAGADLVIDTRAADASGARWIDWSGELPGRRVTTMAHPPALATMDEVRATADGYLMVSPGRDATRHVHVSYTAGADTAATITPGRLAEGWSGKTVSIGDAAALFEPIGCCNLHLATCQIELLLELLPGREIDSLERAEYNRRAGMLADRVRDFVAAHHVPRTDRARSDGLASTLREFDRRGRLRYFEEESVPRDLWLQLLTAICPSHAPTPMMQAMPDAALLGRRTAHDRRVAAAVAAAEPYPAWLARAMEMTR